MQLIGYIAMVVVAVGIYKVIQNIRMAARLRSFSAKLPQLGLVVGIRFVWPDEKWEKVVDSFMAALKAANIQTVWLPNSTIRAMDPSNKHEFSVRRAEAEWVKSDEELEIIHLVVVGGIDSEHDPPRLRVKMFIPHQEILRWESWRAEFKTADKIQEAVLRELYDINERMSQTP